MREFIITIIISFFCISANAEELSPVEESYKKQQPKLFTTYSKAVVLLDNYRGDRELLNRASILLSDVLAKDKSFAPAYREVGRLLMKAGHKYNYKFEW